MGNLRVLLQVVENATASATTNENLTALLFENAIFIDYFLNVSASNKDESFAS